MIWKSLQRADEIETLIEESKIRPVLIFKHSTRCSISAAVVDRLERRCREEDMSNLTPYFLDLIQHRDVSNAIAEKLAIRHESPQAIILRDGKSIYDASHFGIDYEEIADIAKTEVPIKN